MASVLRNTPDLQRHTSGRGQSAESPSLKQTPKSRPPIETATSCPAELRHGTKNASTERLSSAKTTSSPLPCQKIGQRDPPKGRRAVSTSGISTRSRTGSNTAHDMSTIHGSRERPIDIDPAPSPTPVAKCRQRYPHSLGSDSQTDHKKENGRYRSSSIRQSSAGPTLLETDEDELTSTHDVRSFSRNVSSDRRSESTKDESACHGTPTGEAKFLPPACSSSQPKTPSSIGPYTDAINDLSASEDTASEDESESDKDDGSDLRMSADEAGDSSVVESSPRSASSTSSLDSNSNLPRRSIRNSEDQKGAPRGTRLGFDVATESADLPVICPYDKPRSPESIATEVYKCMQEDIPKRQHNEKGSIYVFNIDNHPGHVKIGRTVQTVNQRKKQVGRCYGPVTDTSGETYFTVGFPSRLERIIKQDLHNERRTFKCPRESRDKRDTNTLKKMERQHEELYELDAERANDCVNKWRDWIMSNPYEDDGASIRLSDEFVDRIQYFGESSARSKFLLEQHEKVERWDPLLKPDRVTRLKIAFHGWVNKARVSRWKAVKTMRVRYLFWRALLIGCLYFAGGYWLVNLFTHVIAIIAFI